MWKEAQIYTNHDWANTLFCTTAANQSRTLRDSIDWYFSNWLKSELGGQRNQWTPELVSTRAKDSTLLDILALTLG